MTALSLLRAGCDSVKETRSCNSFFLKSALPVSARTSQLEVTISKAIEFCHISIPYKVEMKYCTVWVCVTKDEMHKRCRQNPIIEVGE